MGRSRAARPPAAPAPHPVPGVVSPADLVPDVVSPADPIPGVVSPDGSCDGGPDEYRRRYEELLRERAVEMREAASRVRREADERRQAEAGARADAERFRILVEHSSDLILVIDPRATITYCSPSVERLIGYSQDEVTGRLAAELIDPRDLAAIPALRSRDAERTGGPDGGTLRVRCKDGSERWFDWAASSHLDDETIGGYVVNARDATDRVLAERALRASEARYRALAEASPDMIYVIGADLLVRYVNDYGARSLGAPAERLVGAPLGDLFRGETGERLTAAVERVLRTGATWESESSIAYRDGERWVDTRLVALRDDESGATAVLGVSHDVTERRLAQNAMADSERRYRSLFMDSPVPLWEEDHSAVKPRLDELARSGVDDIEAYLTAHPDECQRLQSLIRCLDVNHAAVALCGSASRDDVIAGATKLYPPGCLGGMPSFWAAALTGQQTSRFEIDASGPGRTLHVMETYIVAPGCEDTFERVYVADADVTERRQAEELLYRYRLLFAEARDVIWIVRASDGRIVEANAAAEAAYGYTREELLHRHISEMRADGCSPALTAQIASAAAGDALFEAEHRRKDGSIFPVEVSARGIPADDETLLLSVIRDATDRRRTEDELARTTEQLERTLRAAVAALGTTAELRDPYTAGHQRRVAELACAIATELDWTDRTITALHTAALLHDLGKIVVPAEILSKPGKLTDIEFLIIRQHAAAGAEILADIDFDGDVGAIVRQHHERLDGSGYPDGLRDGDILPSARVLAVADVVEAMVSHRPYRPALPLEAALAEIESGSGRRYDADACAACLRLLRENGFTFSDPD